MKTLARRAEQEKELDGPGKKAQAGESAEADGFRHNQLRPPTPPSESSPAAAGPPEHKPVRVRRRSPAPSEASQDDQSASHEPAGRERPPWQGAMCPGTPVSTEIKNAEESRGGRRAKERGASLFGRGAEGRAVDGGGHK